METLIFHKKSPCGNKYPTIRIQRPIYAKLLNIADETGMTISAVANQMLSFAVEHSVITGCCSCGVTTTICNEDTLNATICPSCRTQVEITTET